MAYKVRSVNLQREICSILLKEKYTDGYTVEEILQELELKGIKFENGQSVQQVSRALRQLFAEGKLTIITELTILELDLNLELEITGVIEKAKRR